MSDMDLQSLHGHMRSNHEHATKPYTRSQIPSSGRNHAVLVFFLDVRFRTEARFIWELPVPISNILPSAAMLLSDHWSERFCEV